MSRGDATTLSLFLWETFAIQTYDFKRLKDFARDLLDNPKVTIPFNVRQAAERALMW